MAPGPFHLIRTQQDCNALLHNCATEDCFPVASESDHSAQESQNLSPTLTSPQIDAGAYAALDAGGQGEPDAAVDLRPKNQPSLRRLHRPVPDHVGSKA